MKTSQNTWVRRSRDFDNSTKKCNKTTSKGLINVVKTCVFGKRLRVANKVSKAFWIWAHRKWMWQLGM